jgi:hypothetical protein
MVIIIVDNIFSRHIKNTIIYRWSMAVDGQERGERNDFVYYLSMLIADSKKKPTMLIGPSPIHRDPSYSTSGAAHPLVALYCTSFRLPRRCLRHGQGASCRCSPHALPRWPARDLGRHGMQVQQVPKPASIGRSKPASTGRSKPAIIRNPLLPRPKDSIVSNCRDVSSCLHDGTGVFLKTNFMMAHS